jgi:hypothetical protein
MHLKETEKRGGAKTRREKNRLTEEQTHKTLSTYQKHTIKSTTHSSFLLPKTQQTTNPFLHPFLHPSPPPPQKNTTQILTCNDLYTSKSLHKTLHNPKNKTKPNQ